MALAAAEVQGSVAGGSGIPIVPTFPVATSVPTRRAPPPHLDRRSGADLPIPATIGASIGQFRGASHEWQARRLTLDRCVNSHAASAVSGFAGGVPGFGWVGRMWWRRGRSCNSNALRISRHQAWPRCLRGELFRGALATVFNLFRSVVELTNNWTVWKS